MCTFDLNMLNFHVFGQKCGLSAIGGHFVISNVDVIHSRLYEIFGLSRNDYYFVYNGKKIDTSLFNTNINNGIVHVIPRIVGGKGGFGSMLRAIGAQIEKTTNREACRDLSGRRLRDINEEQRLKNWISQQADREREAAERKKKKLERLCQEPKHDFKDDNYDESRAEMTEKMSSSIEQGFQASSSGITKQTSEKRKLEQTQSNKKKPIKKKKTLWIDAEDSDSSSAESTDIEDNKKDIAIAKHKCSS